MAFRTQPQRDVIMVEIPGRCRRRGRRIPPRVRFAKMLSTASAVIARECGRSS